MRTVDATTRAAFLSAAAQPQNQAFLRRIRLDFGSAPIVQASSGSLETGNVSEDYYRKYILGAMCADSAGYVVRVANKAAAGVASDYYHMRTTTPHTPANWEYSDTVGGPSISAYCRLGVYPTGVAGHVYVWYASSVDDEICRVDFNASAGTWGTPTATSLDVGDWDSIAIHPVGGGFAFVVGFTDPYLWVGTANWTGSAWTAFSKHVVACVDGANPFNFAQFSAAVKMGVGSLDHTILLNMAAHGAVYAVRYGDANIFTQPTLAAGANADWGGIQAFPTGAAWINDRIWAVVNRAIESSEGEAQAYHSLLMSSPDGLHWREEDYVGIYPCYGSPLVDGNYIYVAGNTVVYEADATVKVGVDNASLKTELVDTTRWSLTMASNSPSSIQMPAVLGDSSTVDEALLEPGAEVELQVRDVSGGWVDFAGGYIETKTDRDAYAKASSKRTIRGPIGRLAGAFSYHHPLGMGFDGPIVYNTDFNTDDANAKISVRQVTGKFAVEFNPGTGKWEVEGERGIALIPTSIRTQWLQMQMHAWPMQSLEGLYFVFYYEDVDNYWRAGFQRDEGNSSYDLVIEQVYLGEPVQRAISSSVGSSSDIEMSMFLTLMPGDITVRVNINSASNDFTSSTTLSYDPIDDLLPVPTPHHVGVEVEDMKDYNGADKDGTVESSTKSSITDTGVFATGDAGKWIHCNDQWRRISRATTDIAYVSPNWTASPPAGSEFGVYPEDRGPYARLTSVSLCDGNYMWSVGDVAESIMQMAGVNMVEKETTSVGVLGIGDIQAYDIDLSLSEDCTVAIHATDGASPNYWAVAIDGPNSEITLSRYIAGTPTVVAAYPAMITISDADADFRVVHYRDNVYVYCCGHFVCAFWDVKTAGSGRVAASSGTATQSEFPSMVESFVWDAAQPATSAIARLLRGRPAKMIEIPGGAGDIDNVKVSKFAARDDLGTWSTTVLGLEEGIRLAPSLVELEGEDVREYHLDTEQARKHLMFRRSKSEFARGTQQTRSEARRVIKLGKEESRRGIASMSLPDPATQPEDEVTIDGTVYIVTAMQVRGGHAREGLSWGAQYRMRKKAAAVSGGVWGTDEWGDFKWG